MKAYKLILTIGVIVEIIIVAMFVDVRLQSTLGNNKSKINSAEQTPIAESAPQGNTVEGGRFGLPKIVSGGQGQIISRQGYTLSYNDTLLLPNWVAYELTREEVGGQVPRDAGFYPDPEVRGVQVQTSDYTHSGWDRGHMAPAGDMKWSESAMHESCYLSNICPQNPELNGGTWRVLEEKCRSLISTYPSIHIVCGPVLTDNKHSKIGTSRVTVPDAFFKVMLVQQDNEYHGIGFYFSNEPAPLSLRSYHYTIDEIENITGIDFFSELDESLQNSFESSCSLSFWDL